MNAAYDSPPGALVEKCGVMGMVARSSRSLYLVAAIGVSVRTCTIILWPVEVRAFTGNYAVHLLAKDGPLVETIKKVDDYLDEYRLINRDVSTHPAHENGRSAGRVKEQIRAKAEFIERTNKRTTARQVQRAVKRTAGVAEPESPVLKCKKQSRPLGTSRPLETIKAPSAADVSSLITHTVQKAVSTALAANRPAAAEPAAGEMMTAAKIDAARAAGRQEALDGVRRGIAIVSMTTAQRDRHEETKCAIDKELVTVPSAPIADPFAVFGKYI